MSNTGNLYNAMRNYTDVLLNAHSEYLETMKQYETAKGSAYYEEMREKATDKRKSATDAIKADTLRMVDSAISEMLHAASTRKPIPLSDEQLRIIQALKLRDKVSADELIQAGNAMEGNLSGLAILQEMAQKSGMMHNFIADAKGIAGETLNRAIHEMKQRCYSIINSDGVNMAAMLAAKYHARHYGSGSVDTDDLPAMNRFANEADFLAAVLPAGVNASYFAEAVNN